MKKFLLIIVLIIILIGVYFYTAIQKFTYDYKVLSFKTGYIDIINGNATIHLTLQITMNGPFFFNIPVNYLYYEIYYGNSLLGKSNHASSFVINKKPSVTVITQDVDLILNKTNLQVALNYAKKIPTEYTVRIITNVFGFNINIGNIKFTY